MASLPFDVQSESLGRQRAIGPASISASPPRARSDSIVLTVAYGGTFDGKAWFSGVNIDQAAPDDAGVGRSLARARRRHHLRPRLSLSRRRMDLPPRRRPTLRARLPARASDGQGNPAIHGALRRRAGSQRQEQKLEPGAHHRHRSLPARLRSGDSGGNEGHRRRRLRRRRPLGRPPHRPYRHRGREHHGGTRRSQPGASRHSERPGRPAPGCAPELRQSQTRRRAGSLQRFRRHRLRHSRWPHGYRPHHLVAAHVWPSRPT